MKGQNEEVRLTFLGTGTSQGVPVIGCGCEVCSSQDGHDKRLRASALVETCGMRVLIDAGPDFRYQMLRAGVGDVDAILLTHNHKDHTGGLDDVRAFNWLTHRPTRIYCEDYVLKSLRNEYSYVFARHKYPGIPEWDVHIINSDPFSIAASQDAGGKVDIVPIRGMHYKLPVLGFRFGRIAYCTDMNLIPESEFDKLHGLEHFVINCVTLGPHISHFSLPEAVETARRVGARHSWLTHLSHRLPRHAELCAQLPPDIRPAYDGLVITA